MPLPSRDKISRYCSDSHYKAVLTTADAAGRSEPPKRTACSSHFLLDVALSWPAVVQVWANHASVSCEDHMPCVVDVGLPAGRVADCHP